jgi:phosphoglycolate phosphatase
MPTYKPAPLSSSPVAIFDFDGTIADSLELVLSEFNRLAPRFRVKPIDRDDLARVRKMKASAAMKEHGVSFWKLPLLVSAMRSALHKHVAGLEPCEGMAEALRALAKNGCRCSVLSTNSSQNIERFLERHDLKMFERIAGGASMFGKARALSRLIARAKLDASQVYYVGDEVRDIDAAAAAGVHSIAVSWGYAERGALEAHSPTYIADRPDDLLRLLA